MRFGARSNVIAWISTSIKTFKRKKGFFLSQQKIELWRGGALAFLKQVLQEKQIYHETYFWNQADYVS
jgi:hypothetical protein